MRENFSTTYLGAPLFPGRMMACMFEPLVDKILNKIETWKAKLLSQGDQLILLRHVLSRMASHTLTIYLMAKMVVKNINAHLSTFF